ncbi:MAG: PAS domain S-box protein [Desulfobacteraceae bacterium]
MRLVKQFDEEKLRFLESVFDAIQEGIIILDCGHTIMRANRWMEKHFASRMPLIGKKCYEILHSRQKNCSTCPVVQTLETGMPTTQILTYPPGQAPNKWFMVSAFRLREVDGSIVGAIEHIKDITGLKRTEALLKDEIRQRRILVEQSRDGIVVLDHGGKVYESNQKFARMLGYTMEEMQHLYVWDWDIQFKKSQLKEMVRTVDESGDHFETFHRRKDGSSYQVEISTNGAAYRGQKLIFCVCRDITERKRAEKEREKLIQKLREALAEIKTLRGILPLCSFCKKIRDDKGFWEQVDVYIEKHSLADISHSVCPECMEKYYSNVKASKR